MHEEKEKNQKKNREVYKIQTHEKIISGNTKSTFSMKHSKTEVIVNCTVACQLYNCTIILLKY